MAYCSCLPTYTPGPPGSSTPVCPPGCLQAASVIQPTEQGLTCNDVYTVDLADLTNPGSCENVVYSIITDPSVDEYTLIGSVFTFTLTDTAVAEGAYIEFEYKMKCSDDARSVSGSIQLYIITNCP